MRAAVAGGERPPTHRPTRSREPLRTENSKFGTNLNLGDPTRNRLIHDLSELVLSLTPRISPISAKLMTRLLPP